MKHLKTSDIARSAGIHPNTVRLYERWGLLPPVPRSPSGYRLFTPGHLEQVRLVRLAMRCTMLGREIRRLAYDVIHHAAAADFAGALENSRRLAELITRERRQAEAAEEFLEQWAGGLKTSDGISGLSISEAADLLDVTVDMLRDWERNSLIAVPRRPENGYRVYGAGELNRLKVIRLLRRSRYGNMAILRVLQNIESGNDGNIKDIIDTPILDEERGYLCFTDSLLSTLSSADQAAAEIILLLENKINSK
jgi:DNA-binding transcriptional MerR regulator